MLTSITLKNFQKLGSREIVFAPGLNLIVGDNWVGKSTLLRAIQYALGGVSATGVKKEDLVTTGKTSMLVTLRMDAGRKLRIVRGPNTAILYDDETEETLASGHTVVTETLEEYLGLSVKDFYLFRVVRQGEPDALLKAGSTLLSQCIYRITGVDTIDKAFNWLETTRIEAMGIAQGASIAAESKTVWETKLEQATASMKRLKHAMEGFESPLREYSDAFQQWSVYRDSLTKINLDWSAWNDQLNQAKLRVSDLKTVMDTCRKPSASRPSEQAYKDLAERSDALKEQLDALIEGCRTRGLAEMSLNRATYGVREAEAVLEQDLANPCPESSEPFQQAVLEAHAKHEHLKKQVEGLREELKSGVCQSCNRPFSGDYDPEAAKKALKTLLAEVSMSQQELAEKTAQRDNVRQRLAQRAQAQAGLGSAKQRFEEALKTFEAESSKLEKAGFDLFDLKGEEQRLREALSETREKSQACLTLRQEWDAYTSQAESLSAALTTAQQQEAGLLSAEPQKPDAGQLEHASTTLEALSETLKNLEQQKQESAHALIIAERDEREASERLKELEKRAAVAEKASLREQHARQLVTWLRKHREKFLQDTWEAILGYCGSFLREATGDEITELVRDSDKGGGFSYVENGVTRPVAVASGMQLAIMGVALKLALGAALGGSARLLILDEVTAPGTNENSLALVKLLKEHSPQTILVTHRQADTVFADTVIELP